MGAYVIHGSFTNADTSPSSATAEDALSANPERLYLFVQNIEASGGGTLWIDVGQDAVEGSPSFRIEAGGSIEFSASGSGFVPTGRVSVISTGGTAYTAKEA